MRAAVARRSYLSILLIAAAACACAHHGASPETTAGEPAPSGVKVQVTGVGIDRDSGAHYVLLEDNSQSRGLPILIGDNEAEAIMLELHGLKSPRPLTYDLLRSVIAETGNHVDRVEISDLHDEVYLARIFLDHGRHSIDSRPSDAIALAMGTNAPIYVNDKLLVSSADLALGAEHFPKSEHGFGLTVQDLTPELAAYFKVPPKSALLVAEVDGEVKQAGVGPGDLLTKIDGAPVRGLDDFDQQAAMVRNGATVTLTIRRGAIEKSVAVNLRDGRN